MYSNDDIASAVRAGVLSERDAAAFRAHVAELRSTPAVDEEYFRLVTGFNDIFVVIACALLLVSLAWIGAAVDPGLGAMLQTAAAWWLALYFTARRRMALPSIVLLLAFVGGVFASVFIVGSEFGLAYEMAAGLACVTAAVGAWIHWRWFKVPITVAACTATVAAGVIFLLIAVFPPVREWVNVITLVAGLAVFGLALGWDASDTLRQTRRSDVAFWLHLVAAPLLVHPVFSFLDVFEGQAVLWQGAVVVLLYAVMAFVSISIDRRALMVSSLVYVLYVLSGLLQRYGVVSLSFAFVGFTIGSGLLLLSALWHSCRKYVLRYCPERVRVLLPPLR